MSRIRIGINGFGRIGRCVLKQLMARPEFEVVGINDLADIGDLAYLLNYDSVHGWYPSKVKSDERSITVLVLRDRVVKILSWYDNEWGYSARLVDLAGRVGGKGPD